MVSFQSRVSIWASMVKPYTDIEIDKLGEKHGKDRSSLPFIHCTLGNIRRDRDALKNHLLNQEAELVYIPCLNNNPEFINALESIIEDAVV